MESHAGAIAPSTERAVAGSAGHERLGDWMITFTGRRFWPLDPRAEDVSFRDIGHALSLICRYGGHVRRFYSVAEHSWRLAQWFLAQGEVELARYALLHDAPEAYIGDMIRPLKPSVPHFCFIDGLVEKAVLEAAGLRVIPQAVHDADARIIANEARELFAPEVIARAGWTVGEGLPGVVPLGDPAYTAERLFAAMFGRLFPELDFD